MTSQTSTSMMTSALSVELPQPTSFLITALLVSALMKQNRNRKMGDKSWLCVVCGHYIVFAHEAESIPEGGRAHHYCLEAEKVGAADERERIIKLLQNAVEGERKLLNARPDRTDFQHRFYKISVANSFIDLIKGEQE